MRWTAIIVAAGRGRRFGRPKQFVDLAGRPVVAWSIALFAAMQEINEIILVTEHDSVRNMDAVVGSYAAGASVGVVVGGATRQESVRAGLSAVSPFAERVFVHDGARPLVRSEDIRRGMRYVEDGRASILATPVIDTLKVVDEQGRVARTLDRSTLWASQTPQFATFRDMKRAHADAERERFEATDDAALLERAGVQVAIVQGSDENFKITTPGDLARATQILRERGPLLPSEQEVLLLEAFVPTECVDKLLHEIEYCNGDVDGIDRDLPNAVAIRAYLPEPRLVRFRLRFEDIVGDDGTFTTRFSHAQPR